MGDQTHLFLAMFLIKAALLQTTLRLVLVKAIVVKICRRTLDRTRPWMARRIRLQIFVYLALHESESQFPILNNPG